MSTTSRFCIECRKTQRHTRSDQDGEPVMVCECDAVTPLDLTKRGGFDRVARPEHYNSHPSGVECIEVVEHMGFCIGNAIKYLWRAGLKGDAIEDLRKARWYVEREIARREKEQEQQP